MSLFIVIIRSASVRIVFKFPNDGSLLPLGLLIFIIGNLINLLSFWYKILFLASDRDGPVITKGVSLALIISLIFFRVDEAN